MSHSLPAPVQVEKNKTTAKSSSKSNDAALYQLPGLPSSISVPLAAGTSIPQPPPSPPPPLPPLPPSLEKMAPSTTPERAKPNTKSTILPSSPLTRDMPGAFPASRSPSPSVNSPQTPRNYSRGSNSYTASAYTNEALPRSSNSIPHSNSPRRPSGLRNLLIFRRSPQASADPNGSQGESSRPSTPSLASIFGLSFGRTPGGSFWKKKTVTRTPGGEKSPSGLVSPMPNGHDPDVAELDARRTAPHPERHSETMNRKTTKEFWRRKSSGTLNVDAHVTPKANGIDASGGEETPVRSPSDIVDPMPRIRSPPPKLPELNAPNGYMDPDDMFRNIR